MLKKSKLKKSKKKKAVKRELESQTKIYPRGSIEYRLGCTKLNTKYKIKCINHIKKVYRFKSLITKQRERQKKNKLKER